MPHTRNPRLQFEPPQPQPAAPAAVFYPLTEISAFSLACADRDTVLAALRESEKRFRSAFDNAAIGMALVSLTGRWIQVSRSLTRILGYTEPELLATNFQSITHPDDLDADLTFVRRLIADEIENYSMVKRYVHRFGHLVWALLSVSLVRDDAGKPLYFISQIQDITQRHRAEEALRASEEEYRAMFDLAGVGKMQTDLQTRRFLKVNRKFADMLGYSVDELLCLSFEQITPAEDRPASAAAADALLRGDVATQTLEKRYLRKDGRIIWVSLNVAIIRDPDGKCSRAVATVKDITDRKDAQQFDADHRAILQMVLQGHPLESTLGAVANAIQHQIPRSTCAFLLLNDGQISIHGTTLPPTFQNLLHARALSLSHGLAGLATDAPSRCSITSLQSDPLWQPFREAATQSRFSTAWALPILSSDTSSLGLLVIFCERPEQPTPAQVRILDTAATLATLSIEHHNTSHRLAHLVRHDPLTGLANRVMFHDRFQNAVENAGREDATTALLLLDIDNFKSINDSFGHNAGDHLLQLFGQRLQGCVRSCDTVARLSGDEFAIILTNVPFTDFAATVALRIVSDLRTPFHLPGHDPLLVTTSIGIALAPQNASDAPALQEAADAALYRAKAGGRNRFSF